jgi:recombinational DNA repair protein RecT
MQKLTIDELNKLTPFQVLEDERVKDRFLNLFKNLHGVGNEEAERFFEREKYNFQRIIQSSEHLQQCTGFSIYGCLLDVASMGLSLEYTSQPLLYVLWGNAKQGDKWVKMATLEVSPYGELALRMQKGQLLYADSPVIVYEGDTFKPIVNDKGQKICIYEAKVPRQSKKIIGAFIRLTRPDNSFDFSYMLPDDIERLKDYSEKKNKGKTNALYSSNDGQIDTGFLAAKVIKHAFKTFPKIKIGQFSKLQEAEPQADDYGLSEPVKPEMTAATRLTAPVYESQPEPEPSDVFGGAPINNPKPIIVNDDDDVF